MFQQPLLGFQTKSIQIKCGSVHKWPACANGMNARQKATNPFQHFGVVELGRAATAARADAEGKSAKMVQGRTLQHQRANGGHFKRHQLGGETVFFQYLRIAPAIRAIELRDHLAVVLKVYLIDAIFVRRERCQTPIAAQSHAVQRIQDQIGGEGFKSMVHAGIVAALATVMGVGLFHKNHIA